MAKELTVYYTSDIHGYLYGTDFLDNESKPMGLYGMRFPKDGNTLIIDGGDTIQGSPLTWYCHDQGVSCPAARAMNDRGYTYVTLGNHDFNYGRKWLKAHLDSLNAQCLCANVTDRLNELPIKRHVVHTLENGLRAGIFGITTDWVRRWEKPGNLKDFVVESPLDAARREVFELKSAGAEMIICIYHGGLEKDPDTGKLLSDTDENIACRLAEALPIDLLLTGHQHIGMADKRWHGTHIVQTPCNARAYARVRWSQDTGFRSELLPVPAGQTLSAQEKATLKDLERFLDRPVGHLSRPLPPGDKLDMALHGSALADFFNRVQLWASGADISCTSLANEVRGFDSVVSLRDVVASYPYANTLTVLSVTGAKLRRALEQCARYFDVRPDGSLTVSGEFLQPKAAHYNYDYFSGIGYTFDLSAPPGSRVRELTFKGRPVEPDDTFSLCMNSYRATGVGHFEMWLGCPCEREIQTEISELIMDYLKEHPKIEIPEAPFKHV